MLAIAGWILDKDITLGSIKKHGDETESDRAVAHKEQKGEGLSSKAKCMLGKTKEYVASKIEHLKGLIIRGSQDNLKGSEFKAEGRAGPCRSPLAICRLVRTESSFITRTRLTSP